MATKTTETTKTSVADDNHVPNYVELITQAGDSVLASISEAQETFLEAAQKVAGTLPKAPEVPLPVGDVQLPAVREIVEANFAFVDKYVANQKAYADKVLKLVNA